MNEQPTITRAALSKCARQKSKFLSVFISLVQLAAFCIPAKASFRYGDFTSVAGLNLQGDAAQAGATLRLTRSVPYLAGTAWHQAKQQVANGFETTFSFRILPSGNNANGLAFIIQNFSATALGGHGGGIGYAGIPNCLAVELDTYVDREIAVQSMGTATNSYGHEARLAYAPIADLADGAVHTVKITHSAGVLAVYLDDMNTPTLTYAVDLSTLLNLDNGRAWVGLGAGTGESYEEHQVLSWSFTSVDSIALFNTGVDATGVTLPGGAANPHWTIMSGPGIATPMPAVVLNNQYGYNYAQSPVSRWVWANAEGVAGFHSPYTFRMTFDLTGMDPRTAIISGQWGADNDGFVRLNGSTNNIGTGALELTSGLLSNYEVFHAFALTNGFLPGVNVLEFVVTDYEVGGGFNVTDLAGTAQGLPPAIARIRVSQVEICWQSSANFHYQVQYRSSLSTNEWVNFGTPIVGDGNRQCVTDAVSEGEPQRFYRIITLPLP